MPGSDIRAAVIAADRTGSAIRSAVDDAVQALREPALERQRRRARVRARRTPGRQRQPGRHDVGLDTDEHLVGLDHVGEDTDRPDVPDGGLDGCAQPVRPVPDGRLGGRDEHADEVRRGQVAVGGEQPLEEGEVAEDGLGQVDAAPAVADSDLPDAGQQRDRRGDRVGGPDRPWRGEQQRAVPLVVPVLLAAGQRDGVRDPDQTLTGGRRTGGQTGRRVGREQVGKLAVGNFPAVDPLRMVAVGDR